MSVELYNGTSWVTLGNGTITSITAGTGLTGGTITTSGTIAIANTAVTAGSYTLSNITVGADGRLTSASNGVAVASVTGTANQILIGGTATAPTIGFVTSGSLTLPTDTVVNSVGYLQLPVGTTAQRPSTPVAGMIRFSTSL